MNLRDMYIHEKTGKPYWVLHYGVTNATNGPDDGMGMVLYVNEENKVFARRAGEFYQKFRLVSDSLAKPEREHAHYFKDCPYDEIDIYRILDLFEVTDQTVGHAIKKLMVAGGRGAKDKRKDIKEAADTLVRRMNMWKEDDRVEEMRRRPPGVAL